MNATKAMAAILIPLAMNGACLAGPVYDFAFTDFGVNYAGKFTLGSGDGKNDGGYNVVAISGTESGGVTATFSVLSTYQGADNIFFPSGSPHYVDNSGISWTDSSGLSTNFFFGTSYYAERQTYGVGPVTGLSIVPDAGAVPEPASLAMTAGTLGAIGLGAWVRRRHAARESGATPNKKAASIS